MEMNNCLAITETSEARSASSQNESQKVFGEPGDVIEVFKQDGNHLVVNIGDGSGVYLTISRDSKKALVKNEPLHTLVGDSPYLTIEMDDKTHRHKPVQQIIIDAKAMIGEEIDYCDFSNTSKNFITTLLFEIIDNKKVVPKAGDLIEIPRRVKIPYCVYQHWALYVSHGFVVHLASTGHLGKEKSVVKKELLLDVVGNDKFQINNLSDKTYTPKPAQEIVRCALEKVGDKIDYHLIKRNCEHFVNEVRYGIPFSKQSHPLCSLFFPTTNF
ncbi:uncharacterized protein LOC121931152 isoform X2 [Sceloporus undulatus]|uniref:uncharacterized protein LOC121931152 isoform X2 n=1 Tax=Sceloporus undulatus TaxID=8520 RepID=UPI001C4B6150|nr:uncharacterized protein LOC121931152 isoform X2 [Sceloporus undulatus]